jgi:hypothetical protein
VVQKLIIFKKRTNEQLLLQIAEVKLFIYSLLTADDNLLMSSLTIPPKVTLPQIKEKEISLKNTMTADYKGGLSVG